MIEFIKENIGWIKDFVMLLFAGTGTVITILTYRRARATILQPIRNEVIKKQSELLSELLSLCQPSSKIDTGIDYIKLVQANVLLHLRDYGFIFDNQEKFFEVFSKDIVGWLPCGESQILEDVEIISSFEQEYKSQSIVTDSGKKRYEEAKRGNIKIDKIYLTTSHKEYMEKLHLLSINPFMPSPIQHVLTQLTAEVDANLKEVLKKVLKAFIAHFFEKSIGGNGYPKFDPTGVYNEFNHQRIHHRETISRLAKESRSYLRIDEPWE